MTKREKAFWEACDKLESQGVNLVAASALHVRRITKLLRSPRLVSGWRWAFQDSNAGKALGLRDL